MVLHDQRITMPFIAKKCDFSVRTAKKALHPELRFKKVTAKNVNEHQADDYLNQIKTWIHHYDLESKRQGMKWRHGSSLPPRKFRIQSSAATYLGL